MNSEDQPVKIELSPNPTSLGEAQKFMNPDERLATAHAHAAEQANEDVKANRELRDKYAKWIFSYLVGYSIVVGILIVLSGFQVSGFHLETSVLEFLVGSTAVSAIGLVLAVTTGLFRPR